METEIEDAKRTGTAPLDTVRLALAVVLWQREMHSVGRAGLPANGANEAQWLARVVEVDRLLGNVGQMAGKRKREAAEPEAPAYARGYGEGHDDLLALACDACRRELV